MRSSRSIANKRPINRTIRPHVGVVSVHHETEIAQYLGRLSLAEQHVDPARLEKRLLDVDSGHRVQKPHIDPGGGSMAPRFASVDSSGVQ
ncbi:hypothetical protein [Candidatus Palauibacter sp.]|uniref:hypothetical protein n=1 Tax=Candidatus Palauibacter sp. TaxID=3101350 RepID=UPI003AF29E42